MKKLRHIAAAALGAIVLAGTCSFSACGKGANVIKKDSYTADNRLILEYYGVDIDTLQAMTNDTKLIVDYIENKFQVDFKFITGTATTWLETLNRNIAVGDVPDLFFHDAKDPSYSTWLKEKYLYDFGTQLDKYPNLTAQFAKYSEEMKEYLGGAWYGLPLILDEDAKGTVVSEHAMYYRRDWYEKVKDYIPSNRYADENHRTIKDPEAADFDYIDFYNLCEAFAKGDPDGDGKDNTAGFCISKEGGIYWWNSVLSMFNVAYDGWTKNPDGSYSAQCISPQMKEAVWFMADMFDNGLLAHNYNTTMTTPNLYAEFGNGKFGIMVANSSYQNAVNIINSVTGGGASVEDIRAMPVVTGKDGVKRVMGVYNFYGFTSVYNDISDTKKAKILEMMDWMLSKEGQELLSFGLEKTHYEKTADGKINSLLGNDKKGYPYYLHSNEKAPGIYFLKGLVSWDKNLLPEIAYYKQSQEIYDCWAKCDWLVLNKFMYMRLDSDLALITSDVNDSVATAYKNIVAKDSGARESIWTDFVNNFNSQNKYIAAVNEWAKKNIG